MYPTPCWDLQEFRFVAASALKLFLSLCLETAKDYSGKDVLEGQLPWDAKQRDDELRKWPRCENTLSMGWLHLLLLLLLLLSHFSCADSVRPHRRQPIRLPHPWDSPGKNTGVGCHFLQCVKVKSESEVAQSCPTLSDPMDCSLPGSSIHGILQARVLVAIAFSRFHLLERSKRDFSRHWLVIFQTISLLLPDRAARLHFPPSLAVGYMQSSGHLIPLVPVYSGQSASS